MRYYFLLLCFFTAQVLNAQVSIRDSAVKIPSFGVGYIFMMTAADLSEKVGSFHSVAPEVALKFNNNFFIKGQFKILFGSKLKEDSTLKHLNSSVGLPITSEGYLAEVRQNWIGYNLQFSLGKIIKVTRANPNSGISIEGGLGFIQHKINYVYDGEVLPQLSGDYLKGYDRLTNGLNLSQGIGYLHFSNSNYFSYYLGFQMNQGFTKNRRDWNFDTNEQDNRSRLDMYYGLEFRMLLPVLPKTRY